MFEFILIFIVGFLDCQQHKVQFSSVLFCDGKLSDDVAKEIKILDENI